MARGNESFWKLKNCAEKRLSRKKETLESFESSKDTLLPHPQRLPVGAKYVQGLQIRLPTISFEASDLLSDERANGGCKFEAVAGEAIACPKPCNDGLTNDWMCIFLIHCVQSRES